MQEFGINPMMRDLIEKDGKNLLLFVGIIAALIVVLITK